VTEEIISKIGAMLPVQMAKSRLVRVAALKGRAPEVRFLSQNFVRRGEDVLIHGIEIVAQYFNAKPEEVETAFNLGDSRSEQSFYTIQNMLQVFRWFCEKDELPSVLDSFARMLAFDALVGAPDRHALNWGVVSSLVDVTWPKTFAPLFDTARGLFREHTDKRLAEVASAGKRDAHIAEYAEKSRPVFGVRAIKPGTPRCNHFELVDYAIRELPDDLGRTMIRFIRAVHLPNVETMLRRTFTRIITPLRMSFILGLLRYRDARLKMLARGTLT
jgi:hypothetical protein